MLDVKLGKSEQQIFLLCQLFSGFSIYFIGNLYLTEIILSLMSCYSIAAGRKVFNQKQNQFIPLLFGLWLLANLISSLLSEKSVSLTLTAIFTVLITWLTTRAVFEFYLGYPEKILSALMLFAIGRLIGVYLNPQPLTSELPWKFGYGEWILFLLLIFAAKIKSYWLLWVFTPIFIVISITNEARTLTFIAFSVLIISLFRFQNRLRVILIVISLALPIVSYYTYLEVALSGSLGAKEISRALILSESGIGPFAARKEFVFSTRAFVNSPIVGKGFDPQVSDKIILAGYKQLAASNVQLDYRYLSTVPLHSFLMSALVQGGIFAGLFWLLMLFRSIKLTAYAINLASYQRPLLVYVLITLINRILFSPYGAYERLNVAFFVSYILIHNMNRKML
jgi:hypothetical protein